MTNYQMSCPESMISHVQQVIFENEYALPGYKRQNPIILDIGANVGAFAVWALFQWPQATIHCFEPNPENFKFLEHNLNTIHPGKNYHLYNKAIGNPKFNRLFLGKNNCGECSFFDLGEQNMSSSIEVDTLSPSELPFAHLIKMDTEGCELNILKSLKEKINDFEAITYEFHRESDRRAIDKLLSEFVLIKGYIRCKDRGVFSYLHKDHC